jgi:hypothetical protein
MKMKTQLIGTLGHSKVRAMEEVDSYECLPLKKKSKRDPKLIPSDSP